MKRVTFVYLLMCLPVMVFGQTKKHWLSRK
ncbi:MAG: hypothetical protein EZS26_002683 [Candidatus Ordinivivax streblomastigis]|uniref:Uncharacterized protein n=1 Tax=Candidatus Ordinivivax streblomastigis TaxID=2540710 RepID=A0A5M8NWD9_9BACT|nr:MAG: hypothetical protein EZS26_002683 [Candidatus Ordinivivax streblomastigis]